MDNSQAGQNTGKDSFAASRECFTEVLGWLEGPGAAALSHAELEDQLDARGRELLRRMFQDHLSLRSVTERRLPDVRDAQGRTHGAVELNHHRPLATVFGQVEVMRLAYRRRGRPNLYPADGALNLPAERHSHGLRRLAATEAARGSFQEATAALERATGQHLGKRQVEALTLRAAVDVDAFYATRAHQGGADDEAQVLVLSVDGKGIVMRPDALRPATAKAAAAATNKLQCRLSKGEKRNRKRLAEVGALYDLTPVPRTPQDVLASKDGDAPPPAPKAGAKWVTASVVHDATTVIATVFNQAQRRDPGHTHRWVALVDGNNHQINRIEAEAHSRGVDVAIVVDLIHVLEYLWAAAWSFFKEADPAAQSWVHHRALAVLNGHAREVATGIKRRATSAGLTKQKRTKADTCAKYLTSKAAYLDYPTALAAGWPIASGVIEGTCRYLVADRMDITGARWSVNGAEAVLKLRALRANNDFDKYWDFHLTNERHRVHETRYTHATMPIAA